MLNVQLIINRKIKSLYVQNVMKRRNWSAEYVRVLLVEFTMDTAGLSLYDFLEGQP